MRAIGHYQLLPEASSRVTCGIKLRKGREGGIRSAVAVRRKNAGEAHARRGDVGGGELHAAKIVIEARRIRANVAVAKIPVDDPRGEQLHFMSRRQGREILLKPLHVDWRVGRNIRAAP